MIEYWQMVNYKLYSSWLLFATLDLISVQYGSCSVASLDVENHLEMGQQLVLRGQLQDALSHYHAAVEGDPHNYLTYFKRGTVYLALGKPKFALLDFDRVLELKPDFHSARFQRGLLLMKQAETERAKADLYHVYHAGDGKYSEEAYNYYASLDSVKYEIESARYYYDNGDYHSAIQLLNKVIEMCPWSHQLRELRSECHLKVSSMQEAISDLRSSTKLLPDNLEAYFKLAGLHYHLGQLPESIREIRECLKLDPDNNNYLRYFKKLKEVHKLVTASEDAISNKDYSTCIQKAKKILDVEKEQESVLFIAKQKLCHCYLHQNELSQSLHYCEEALHIRQDPDIYCDKADGFIASELYDEAIHEFNKALNLDSHFERAQNGLQRAQKLQKMAERRDYYKILNVKRTATKQEIVKAYRKAAQKWHPDNFQGAEKKKSREKVY